MPEHNGKKLQDKIYTVDIDGIGNTEGSNKGGTVKLDRDFILTEIRHVLIKDGNNAIPVQDGAYRIKWSQQNTKYYFKGPDMMADAAFGSVRHGRWKKFTVPEQFNMNWTLEVTVINTIARSEDFSVQVQFHGADILTKDDIQQ